jgi:hypothetical protein
MNERIGELYTEALKYADSRVPAERRYNDIYYAIVSGKHADLIVKECAMLVEGFILEQEVALDDYQEYEASAVLKEHFEIKE